MKGKPGFNISKLMEEYPEKFKPIKGKLDTIREKRGKIVAHGLQKIEQLSEKEGSFFGSKLYEKIFHHENEWHERKEANGDMERILLYKGLSKTIIEKTIEIMDHLTEKMDF